MKNQRPLALPRRAGTRPFPKTLGKNASREISVRRRLWAWAGKLAPSSRLQPVMNTSRDESRHLNRMIDGLLDADSDTAELIAAAKQAGPAAQRAAGAPTTRAGANDPANPRSPDLAGLCEPASPGRIFSLVRRLERPHGFGRSERNRGDRDRCSWRSRGEERRAGAVRSPTLRNRDRGVGTGFGAGIGVPRDRSPSAHRLPRSGSALAAAPARSSIRRNPPFGPSVRAARPVRSAARAQSSCPSLGESRRERYMTPVPRSGRHRTSRAHFLPGDLGAVIAKETAGIRQRELVDELSHAAHAFFRRQRRAGAAHPSPHPAGVK